MSTHTIDPNNDKFFISDDLDLVLATKRGMFLATRLDVEALPEQAAQAFREYADEYGCDVGDMVIGVKGGTITVWDCEVTP